MPLMMLQPGSRARVVEIRGGRGVRQRLSSMGIYPGETLSLVRGGRGGPVIVEARGTRVVIGRGMAHRVMVTQTN
jgi:Fe2+ transport system protein FeoA